jgi:hypothetical protein
MYCVKAPHSRFLHRAEFHKAVQVSSSPCINKGKELAALTEKEYFDDH